MKKEEVNYLDLIPIKSDKIQWKDKDNGLVQIIINRDSLFERLVRKLFFTPDKYRVDLDRIGSFIWRQIDGENTVYDISEMVKDEFKEEADPLYERLIYYINILKNNKFIKI